MENLDIYNKIKSVPQEYLKTIQAGRLKWMSDIKPQWRIMKMTEEFWPCWIGWKIQNIQFHYETFEKETVCNCRLELCIKVWDNWSEPIPWTWWSRFSTVEKNWLYISDESEKMAYTDALSVAMKMLWMAWDVYMWNSKDSSKYEAPKTTQTQTNSDLWVCNKCWTPNVKSPTTWKIYCWAKCWLNWAPF